MWEWRTLCRSSSHPEPRRNNPAGQNQPKMMNTDREQILDAKRRLPLPNLLKQLNLANHARKSSRCPLHDDRVSSFSVWQSVDGWRWKCHAGCGGGDEIDFVMAHSATTRGIAIRQFIQMAGFALKNRVQLGIPPRQSKLDFPSDLTIGTESSWRKLGAPPLVAM